MRVSPTERAAALFATALLLGLVAIPTGAAPLAAASGLLWLVLGGCYAHAARLGRLARRERLSFSWRLAPRSAGGATPVAGAPVRLLGEFRQEGPRPRELRELRPVAPPGVRVEPVPRLLVPPAGRARFTLEPTASAAGRHRLMGLSARLAGPLGLFEVPLYFPYPIQLVALPRPWPLPSRRGPRPSARTAGQSRHHVRGAGLELHELRELLPGDPYHAIAWKPSARLGRWIVREVEREVQRTRWLLVDVSGTLRGGEPGHRKLDAALGLARASAERWLAHGDRVGLVTLDARILSWVGPDDRPAHARRLVGALLDATSGVDADLTALDDDAVASLVLRHLRLHDGLVPSRRPGSRDVDPVELAARLARRAEPGAAELASGIRADRPEARLLRAFCKVRGIPLSWRADPPAGAKDRAFGEALERLARGRPVPDEIVLITDADGMEPFERMLPPIGALRRHGCRTRVVLLPPLGLPPREGRLREALVTVYELDEARRLAAARRALQRAGAQTWSPPRRTPTATGPSSRPTPSSEAA